MHPKKRGSMFGRRHSTGSDLVRTVLGVGDAPADGQMSFTSYKEGTLKKRSVNGKWHNWKKRHFLLVDGGLTYYKAQSDAKPCGYIAIGSESTCRLETKYGENGFVLRSGIQKDLHMVAPTKEEAAEWVHAISKQLGTVLKRRPSIAAVLGDGVAKDGTNDENKGAGDDGEFPEMGRFLYKRTESKALGQAWKRKYFKLMEGGVAYYKNNKSAHAIGFISTGPEAKCSLWAGVTGEDSLVSATRGIFELKNLRRVYLLKAESEAAASVWVNAIQKVIKGQTQCAREEMLADIPVLDKQLLRRMLGRHQEDDDCGKDSEAEVLYTSPTTSLRSPVSVAEKAGAKTAQPGDVADGQEWQKKQQERLDWEAAQQSRMNGPNGSNGSNRSNGSNGPNGPKRTTIENTGADRQVELGKAADMIARRRAAQLQKRQGDDAGVSSSQGDADKAADNRRIDNTQDQLGKAAGVIAKRRAAQLQKRQQQNGSGGTDDVGSNRQAELGKAADMIARRRAAQLQKRQQADTDKAEDDRSVQLGKAADVIAKRRAAQLQKRQMVMNKAWVGAAGSGATTIGAPAKELSGLFVPAISTSPVDTSVVEEGPATCGGKGLSAIEACRREAEAAAQVQPEDTETLQRMVNRYASENEQRIAAKQLKRRGSKRKSAVGNSTRTAV
jgi:hypothetical protein